MLPPFERRELKIKAFAALCLVAIVVVFKFLPETKGLSVEEVVRKFEREARAGSRSGDAPTSR
jgi:hypothetical protein